MSELFEEPDGFRAVAGFVKSDYRNNEYYLDQFRDDPWWPAIERCDNWLNQITPGYSIAQIKEKFGGLRYYVDQGNVSDDVWESKMDAVFQATSIAESWVDGYEYAKREAQR